MPRKGHIVRRDVLPDPIYQSKLVTRVVNTIMLDGKKGTARSIFYGAFNRVTEVTGREPIEVFNEALENISPVIEVRSRRVGGQNYQVPVEVRPTRKQTVGLRWLIQYARLRNEKTLEERLAKEILDASQGLGDAVKKREDVHRMAEANKAFAHYRW
jgi:small subunit ribosomal protein S7